MNALVIAALIVSLTVAQNVGAQSAADAERADQSSSWIDSPMESLVPDNDGVIRRSIDINAQFIAMPVEMLAQMGFKTQQEGWVYHDLCDADLIVMATATKSVSAFSASHNSIFTRVTFEQLHVLRAKRHVQWREPLSVFVMSGALSANGQRYEYINNRAPAYRLDVQYLLRLRADPSDPTHFDTDGFWPERRDGSLIANSYSTKTSMFAALKSDLDRVLAHGDCAQ